MRGFLDPSQWSLPRRPSPLSAGEGPDLRLHAFTEAQAIILNTTDALLAWLDHELERLRAEKL